jgi:hypothetical protein
MVIFVYFAQVFMNEDNISKVRFIRADAVLELVGKYEGAPSDGFS